MNDTRIAQIKAAHESANDREGNAAQVRRFHLLAMMLAFRTGWRVELDNCSIVIERDLEKFVRGVSYALKVRTLGIVSRLRICELA